MFGLDGGSKVGEDLYDNVMEEVTGRGEEQGKGEMKAEWGMWCAGCRESGVQGHPGIYETMSQKKERRNVRFACVLKAQVVYTGR